MTGIIKWCMSFITMCKRILPWLSTQTATSSIPTNGTQSGSTTTSSVLLGHSQETLTPIEPLKKMLLEWETQFLLGLNEFLNSPHNSNWSGDPFLGIPMKTGSYVSIIEGNLSLEEWYLRRSKSLPTSPASIASQKMKD